MFWLVETKEQLEEFRKDLGEEIYLNVIPYNNDHPKKGEICAFYINASNNGKGHIIPMSHNDTFTVELDDIKRVINEVNVVYTNDKKQTLHYIFLQNLKEIGPLKESEFNTSAHLHFYKTNPNLRDINRIIPIVKHYELNHNLYLQLKKEHKGEINEFFDHKANLVFYYIESQGLKIDKEKFNHYFYENEEEKVYTKYNLNTLTKRPSNTYGGINFSALNKNNGERSAFIPENDFFLDIDISAYHPTLLAKLIDYDFKGEDVHLEFSKMYGVSYEEAKELTFKQMYGGVFPKYKNIEFFKKMEDYTSELWEKFIIDKYVECPISGYKFYRKDLKGMKPKKLLNYVLQNYETSLNVEMMWEMIPILNKMKTKLVLYNFDSFLLDVDKEEKSEIIKILKIFKNNKLKIKYKKGSNYDFK